ncbi:hypothetical protein ColLi_09102 [Colletotrichum liriopes]|uniref:Uncharacterized protein n=1 Tax=Colletotrichum liriopes TaxID=708192 RepID=A0AA37GS68_9PEZI|nr:hypothetical protein ColLi_09102 [Colletotrichum liriopes]
MTEAEVSSSLREILKTAANISSPNLNRVFAPGARVTSANGRGIPLRHPGALELVHNTLRSNGIEPAKLKIEYSPNQGEVRFKMPEGVVHATLHRKFNLLVRAATQDKLSHLEELSGSASPLQGRNGGTGQLIPDQGWSTSSDDPWPRLVLEVAVSQSRDHVSSKCDTYIRSGKLVSAAIGLKVFYDNNAATAYEDILNHLGECYIGL